MTPCLRSSSMGLTVTQCTPRKYDLDLPPTIGGGRSSRLLAAWRACHAPRRRDDPMPPFLGYGIKGKPIRNSLALHNLYLDPLDDRRGGLPANSRRGEANSRRGERVMPRGGKMTPCLRSSGMGLKVAQ